VKHDETPTNKKNDYKKLYTPLFQNKLSSCLLRNQQILSLIKFIENCIDILVSLNIFVMKMYDTINLMIYICYHKA
jgi:hypothetical protein